ncbi:MAG: Gfo/Idh/MocA family oxidoreductase [Planctomycetaceae bacterium]|jgi:predicted dehydrogenase|nr:Gfo/Idh/MocA family oxidoreductase [Planctomycetaceae bacterium]
MQNRRQFLSVGGATALAALAFPSPAVLGAEKDKKYRTALVGTGWWGNNILNTAINSKTIEPVAIVDVDRRQLNNTLTSLKERVGIEPPTFSDHREMLEKLKPEIVIVATPDHWHPLIVIDAVKSGAHVYVEKPICHTINEGIAMVKAARGNDRVVQVGTHRRVSPHNISAREFIKSGKLGVIGMIRAFVHYQGGQTQPTPDAPIPEGLDWDRWCGPAPLVPFNPQMHPKGFRRFLNYASGQIGDWGIHWLDQILWCMDDYEPYPRLVASTGGRFVWGDNSDSPDTQSAIFQFEKFNVEWEHRCYSGNPTEKHNLGVYFYGTKGTLHLGWEDGWSFYKSANANGTSEVHVDPQLDKPDNQNIAGLWTDLIESIEKKKRSVCDIELGHRSTTMSLLAMLSLKHGKSVTWDGKKQEIVGDAEASKLLRRDYRAPYVYPEI